MVVVVPLVLPRGPVEFRELVTEPAPFAVAEWPVVPVLPPAPEQPVEPVPPLAVWVQLVWPPLGPVIVADESRAAAGTLPATTVPISSKVAVNNLIERVGLDIRISGRCNGIKGGETHRDRGIRPPVRDAHSIRLCGYRLSAEHREAFAAILQRGFSLGRQGDVVVQGRLDIALPHLTRQFIQ